MLARLLSPSRAILVHSMGKVGSYSIYSGLLDGMRHGVWPSRYDVFHTHQLNGPQIERFVAKHASTPGHIRHSMRFLSREPFRRVDVIAPVRDPLARNVSAYFENLERFGYRPPLGDQDIARLTRTFVDRYRQEIPVTWFDEQVRPVFGINVYDHEPDFSQGGYCIEMERVRLLLVRMEDPLLSRESAIRDFLGLKGFKLQKLNAAEDKTYRDIYRQFKKVFVPSEGLLETVYSSRFAKHFYAAAELEAFRSAWTCR